MAPPLPPKPIRFDPASAPVGVEVKFVDFLDDRPFLPTPPRLQLVHTNGALHEGSVESAWNFSHAKPNENTLPHYQVDRTHGGVTRARKMLPTNRKGIGNGTVTGHEDGHGKVALWSIVIETADLGEIADPQFLTGFDDAQGELVATILAYESITHGIPLAHPTEWFGAGTACHTEPFGFPHWTIHEFKPCPGPAKKRQVREWLLPRAREIVAGWRGQPVGVPVPPLQFGSTGPEAHLLINVLKFWRWYPAAHLGDVNDGVIGERATRGIRAMQSTLGIADTGVYSTRTAARYQRFLRAMIDLAA